MTKGTIQSVWFWRKGEDGPELLMAWDQYTVEQNPDGYEKAWKDAWEAVRSDDAGRGVRHVNIVFRWSTIENAFFPTDVEGEVESA